MDSHRIDQVSAVESVPRQTPKTDFGSVLSQTVAQAAKVGAGIVGGALGSPVVSAAITTANAVIGVVGGNKPQSVAQASTAVTPAGVPTVGGALGGGISATGGDSWALMQAQQQLQSNGQSFEMQYLQLQDQMNKESETFTAVSNIMKVRADAAKNAINNIH
jgi:hypothetical protein